MTPARRAIVLISAAVLLVVLLAAVFRAALLEPLIVRGVQRTLGLHVTFAGIGGSAITGLDLNGVSARGEAGTGTVAAFEARRIGARYSLWALLRGSAALYRFGGAAQSEKRRWEFG